MLSILKFTKVDIVKIRDCLLMSFSCVGVRRINQSATCLSDSNPTKNTNRDGFNFTDNVVEKEEEVNKHRYYACYGYFEIR